MQANLFKPGINSSNSFDAANRKLRFQIKAMPRDGNCGYHAIRNIDTSKGQDQREYNLCDLEAFKQKIVDQVTDDAIRGKLVTTLAEWKEYIMQNQIYIDAIAITAATKVIKRNIVVIEESGKIDSCYLTVTSYPYGTEQFTTENTHFILLRENHYEGLFFEPSQVMDIMLKLCYILQNFNLSKLVDNNFNRAYIEEQLKIPKTENEKAKIGAEKILALLQDEYNANNLQELLEYARSQARNDLNDLIRVELNEVTACLSSQASNLDGAKIAVELQNKLNHFKNTLQLEIARYNANIAKINNELAYLETQQDTQEFIKERPFIINFDDDISHDAFNKKLNLVYQALERQAEAKMQQNSKKQFSLFDRPLVFSTQPSRSILDNQKHLGQNTLNQANKNADSKKEELNPTLSPATIRAQRIKLLIKKPAPQEPIKTQEANVKRQKLVQEHDTRQSKLHTATTSYQQNLQTREKQLAALKKNIHKTVIKNIIKNHDEGQHESLYEAYYQQGYQAQLLAKIETLIEQYNQKGKNLDYLDIANKILLDENLQLSFYLHLHKIKNPAFNKVIIPVLFLNNPEGQLSKEQQMIIARMQEIIKTSFEKETNDINQQQALMDAYLAQRDLAQEAMITKRLSAEISDIEDKDQITKIAEKAIKLIALSQLSKQQSVPSHKDHSDVMYNANLLDEQDVLLQQSILESIRLNQQKLELEVESCDTNSQLAGQIIQPDEKPLG